MSHGKTLKKIQHVFEYLFVRAFHLLVKLTPDKLRVSLCRTSGGHRQTISRLDG